MKTLTDAEGNPPKFGQPVLVTHRLTRVRCWTVTDGARFEQARPFRDGGRYLNELFTEEKEWPGDPVSLDAQPKPSLWGAAKNEDQLAPVESYVVRCRRLAFDIPVTGVLIGSTTKEEGKVTPSSNTGMGDYDPGYLNHWRTVNVFEIALNVDAGKRHAKARIILAHPSDVTPL